MHKRGRDLRCQGFSTARCERVSATTVTSCRFAGAATMARGRPAASVSKLRLAPLFLLSVGLGPVLLPFQESVGHRPIECQPSIVDMVQRLALRPPLLPKVVETPACIPSRSRRYAKCDKQVPVESSAFQCMLVRGNQKIASMADGFGTREQ